MVGFDQGGIEFLDGGDDEFRIVIQKLIDEGFGVIGAIDRSGRKFVEFFRGLVVKVCPVDDEDRLGDLRVLDDQLRCLEAGESLARPGSMPDVAILAPLGYAIEDALDGIILVGPQHHEGPGAFMLDHVARNHFRDEAFFQEASVKDSRSENGLLSASDQVKVCLKSWCLLLA